MGKIDVVSVKEVVATNYPEPFRARVAGRIRKALGDAGGLSQFGVRLTRLRPGAISALRHWHVAEDEFVYVLEGRLTLVTDKGPEPMGPGDCAAFPAGVPDGHHFINNSSGDALYLEIGSRAKGELVTYPDDDLVFRSSAHESILTHKSGEPY